MGMVKWSGNDRILVIKNNEPAYILKVHKDGNVSQVPYTNKRARKSKKSKAN